MDFVTHAAVGALVGRALGPIDRVGQQRAALLGGVVALLPDLDHVLELISAEAYLLQHRTASHSLLAVAIAVLIAALIPGERRRRVGVVAAALASHLLLDVLTPFGTGLLWPFSDARFALDALPIMCPWLAVPTLVLAWLASWRGREDGLTGRFAARMGLGVVLGFCLLGLAGSRLGAESVGGEGAEVLAIPSWQNPVSASVLVADDLAVRHYSVGLISGQAELVHEVPRVQGGAGWAAIASATATAGPLSRFRLPAAEVVDEQVTYYDAQFLALDPNRRPFRILVSPDQPPQVEQMARGVQLSIYLVVLALVAGLGRRRISQPPQSP